MAVQLRKEGVPVDNECRVDMNAFGEIYGEKALNYDKQRIESLERQWRKMKGLSKEEYTKAKMCSLGEKMEMLKTAIFQKNLSPDFIVARSSHYDDIENGVDNIILEKKTGNLVCAFDEVADVDSPRYEEKIDKVLWRNMTKNGGILKYGLKMEKEGGKMELKLGRAKNAPVFYLALSPWLVEEGAKKFKPQIGEQSDYEKIIFNDFINSLNEQIEIINSKFKNLPPSIKERILRFQESLGRFLKNK